MDRKQVDREVNRTLDVYRELDTVPVSDAFFDGVQRRIRQAEADTVQPVSMIKLSLASAALMVLLLVNGLTLFTVLHSRSSGSVSRKAAMMTLMDDYAIRTTTIDFDNGTGGH